MTKQEFKVGDLVRVGGHARYGQRVPGRGPRHHIKSGTVCEVVSTAGIYCTVKAQRVYQIVGPGVLKLAKQAMRKREQYSNRRG